MLANGKLLEYLSYKNNEKKGKKIKVQQFLLRISHPATLGGLPKSPRHR